MQSSKYITQHEHDSIQLHNWKKAVEADNESFYSRFNYELTYIVNKKFNYNAVITLENKTSNMVSNVLFKIDCGQAELKNIEVDLHGNSKKTFVVETNCGTSGFPSILIKKIRYVNGFSESYSYGCTPNQEEHPPHDRDTSKPALFQ